MHYFYVVIRVQFVNNAFREFICFYTYTTLNCFNAKKRSWAPTKRTRRWTHCLKIWTFTSPQCWTWTDIFIPGRITQWVPSIRVLYSDILNDIWWSCFHVFSKHMWCVLKTRLWRKSRSPGTENCTCFGTDLNRNFYANWGSK